MERDEIVEIVESVRFKTLEKFAKSLGLELVWLDHAGLFKIVLPEHFREKKLSVCYKPFCKEPVRLYSYNQKQVASEKFSFEMFSVMIKVTRVLERLHDLVLGRPGSGWKFPDSIEVGLSNKLNPDNKRVIFADPERVHNIILPRDSESTKFVINEELELQVRNLLKVRVVENDD